MLSGPVCEAVKPTVMVSSAKAGVTKGGAAGVAKAAAAKKRVSGNSRCIEFLPIYSPRQVASGYRRGPHLAGPFFQRLSLAKSSAQGGRKGHPRQSARGVIVAVN